MATHNPNNNNDPLAALGKIARMESVPKTDVTANVLRQIRVESPLLAEKPLMWLALGSATAAVIMAIVCTPTLITLMDPLNTLFQSNPTSLL